MKEEQGSVLVEVLVSAIVLTIAAIGVFSAFDAATRSTAQERHRAQAHGLAQSDLARMRTMRISDLSPFLKETRTLTVDGTPYTVESDAEFISDATGTDTCDEDEASADYIRVRSTVTWASMGTRPPVTAESLVAPPNSTTQAESGSLIVQVVNAKDEGMVGVPISGSGPMAFSRETGENGCAVFGNLLKGDYNVTATASGLVDRNGAAPKAELTSVVAEGTNTKSLQYDEPGALEATFVTRPISPTDTPVPAKAQAVAVFNSGMKEARAFKAIGEPQLSLKATSLFPFVSTYSVYAGACEANNPDPTGEHPSDAIADALVTPGESEPVKVENVELPALRLKVYKGTSSTPGSVAVGAKVTVKDTGCPSAGLATLKYETNSLGELTEPGLPYSRKKGSTGGYAICISGTSTSGKRKKTVANQNVPTSVENIAGGTTLTVYLRDESTTSTDCW